MARLAVISILAFAMVGCGKKASTPTAPTASKPDGLRLNKGMKRTELEAPIQSAPTASRLDELRLSKGMKRTELEALIESATGVKSTYSSQYPTESPTEVQYTDGIKTLSVSFKPGQPAPYVEGPDGTVVHYPPIDQEVISWKLAIGE
jgi:hypothetical protein